MKTHKAQQLLLLAIMFFLLALAPSALSEPSVMVLIALIEQVTIREEEDDK